MQPETITIIEKYLFRAKLRDLITYLTTYKYIYTARFFLQNFYFRIIYIILALNYFTPLNHPPEY